MPDPTIRRGSRVEHPRYGQGIVLEVFAAREDAVAAVDWDKRSTRYSPYLDTLTVVPDEHAVRADVAEARIKAALALYGPDPSLGIGRSRWRSGDEFLVAIRAALTDEQPAATPEPPHLDPRPWFLESERLRSEVRADAAHDDEPFGDLGVWRFAPRPADEQGRPYSQDRALYEGER